MLNYKKIKKKGDFYMKWIKGFFKTESYKFLLLILLVLFIISFWGVVDVLLRERA